MKTVHVLLATDYADWEASFALCELRRLGGLRVSTVSLDSKPVCSLAGFVLKPDIELPRLHLLHSALLIIPGSEYWLRQERPDLTRLLRQAVSAGLPVAASGSAVTLLARAALLDDRPHTGNSVEELRRYAPEYKGEGFFCRERAVSAPLVVTASGFAPVEFAEAVFEQMGVPEGGREALRATFSNVFSP
ncbi:MAG: DJ-1/PfpI family protein [Proteobacteria bacterium]|nr:DJ-1/PfpI family protein [Cystobacterineae bacterium]MCL2314541.1 DJ-1/PfpI family protein [Pseudomonadota bacterium]